MLAPRCDLLTFADLCNFLSVKQGSVICITQSYHWPNEADGIIRHYRTMFGLKNISIANQYFIPEDGL